VINTKTKLFGVIGHPVAHSLSPALHNWMLKHFDFNAVYVAFDIEPRLLRNAFKGMQAFGIAGLNVTLPHKASVVDYISFASPQVRHLGVANTIKYTESGLQGYVTDPYGFTESLGSQKEKFQDARVLILGAGGSAQSILYALKDLGCSEIVLYNRTFEKALQLAAKASDHLGIGSITALQSEQLQDAVNDAEIIVNTTSVGMHPDTGNPLPFDGILKPSHFVYDLIYNPLQTPLLRMAEKAGASWQHGLGMLIFQGLRSLQIWTDTDVQLNSNDLELLTAHLIREMQNS
jgi:shikimate dehydrogenase